MACARLLRVRSSNSHLRVERKAARTVDPSPEDSQYEVKSDKLGRSAVHKPSALKKRKK
jgi:hypothetical protein